MSKQATRFPVDVDSLEKGSVISADAIEAAYQADRTQSDYSLKVLRCIDEIYRQLGPRGAGWVIRQREHGIRILTDQEASVLLANEINSSLRNVGRAHVFQTAVDTSAFNDEQVSAHTNRLLRGAAFVQAIAATRRKLRTLAHQAEPVAIDGGDDLRSAATAQAAASAASRVRRAAEQSAPRSE